MTQPYQIRTPETWAQARADYADGLGAEAVCRRYHLGLSNFRRRARKEGWRRADQADPAPDDDGDLSIYDDIDLDEQVEMARLRYVQALDRGRAVEAARWRKLWREVFFEHDAQAVRESMQRDGLSGPNADRARLAQALDAIAGKPTPPENLHDLHSAFPSAEPPAPDDRPLSRAERRRREREARRLERVQNRNASTVPTARPPDATAPPAMA